MWHEARANEKKIKEIMVDHKKRAERRRAFYESRLGDPKQLLRVIGSSTKLYPDAEQYYYHENQDNLMPWQGNTDIRIDRFDGRSLLDFVPEKQTKQRFPNKEQHMMDELNFERYHDLVEAERLGVSEQERLTEVEEEWTKLLERHKALLAMLNNNRKPEKGYAFDYGTPAATNDEMDNEEESQLLKEADILQYVDELTDKDKMILNDMAGKFGIRNYTRLLRMTKRDRDEQLRELKAKQGRDGGKSKDKGGSSRRSRDDRSRRRRRSRYGRGSPSRNGRSSPTYEPYNGSSDSESSAEEDANTTQSDVVIEFGTSSSSNIPEQEETANKEVRSSKPSRDSRARERRKIPSSSSSSTRDLQQTAPAPAAKDTTKKLTPMEKLKLKMRAGLENQIDADDREKRRQERERELTIIQSSYKGEREESQKNDDPASSRTHQHEEESSRRKLSPEKRPRRYYSPSSSSTSDRSPSHSRRDRQKRRYRSPSSDSPSDAGSGGDDDKHPQRRRQRSPFVKRSRRRSRSTSPSSKRRRQSSSSSRHHRHGSSRHHRRHNRSRSPRRRSRSRSRSSRSKRN